MSRRPKTISVDFDGVLHSYPTGWHGAAIIDGGPVEGAIEWLVKMVLDGRFKVCIFSSRSSDPAGRHAMREWLVQNGMDRLMLADVEFPTDKPPAHMAIDDRAVQFVGSFMEPDQIAAFRTWQQQAQSIASKGRADER